MISPSGMLLLSFNGTTAPGDVLDIIAEHGVAGVSLFRHHNFADTTQIADLVGELRSANRSVAPLLIATDQEAGQMMAIGGRATPFAGNMALGAADDPELTRRVAAAIGSELRSLGVNVDYAPIVDISTNPASSSIGIRSFGDDPSAVARHAAAFVEGLQSVGVAATAKHFPGSGDADSDPHYELPLIPHERERLEAVELVPFRSAIDAGARFVMTSHIALPSLTGSNNLPATLAPEVLGDLLRRRLRFDGAIVSDALDMKAITQGPAQIVDVIAAVRAGVDLLLLTAADDMEARVSAGLDVAVSRRLISESRITDAVHRISSVRTWVDGFEDPDMSIVGSSHHRELAGELAARSITIVRDTDNLLPLRPGDGTVLVVQPEPTDLTPADTSSLETPGLADALRRHYRSIDEMVVPHRPDPATIAAVAERAERAEVAVIGTVVASLEPTQADLVRAVLGTGTPTVTIAMRTPYDLAAYPESGTHLATYSISRPSLDAVADVIFGTAEARGRLPVGITGLYERGHGG